MKYVGRRTFTVSIVVTGLVLLLSVSAFAAEIVGTAKNDVIRRHRGPSA